MPAMHRAVAAPSRRPPIHPVWMRVTHWLNALAVLVLVASGWRIYNAAPLLPVRLSAVASRSAAGWAARIQWHFAAMWLLASTAWSTWHQSR